jgi:hypothetical protein
MRRFASQADLLKKLKEQTLSSKGKSRLKSDLRTAIINLQSLFKINKDQSAHTILSNNYRFFAKPLNEDNTVTNCVKDSDDTFFFYFDTGSQSQKAILK